MHYLGESNFLNPAVQSTCKWFIGIPVLSSIHLNYANSAFSVKQLASSERNRVFDANTGNKLLNRRLFIGAEFHTTLLALGYRHDDFYVNFSIIEKVNFPLTISSDAFGLLWNGNHSYEGEIADLKGSASYFNYYREYALGVSKRNANDTYFGIKGKLLFGKLNFSTPSSNLALQTNESSYNLTFNGDVHANISLPVNIESDNSGIQSIEMQEEIDYVKLLLNRKNWGVAFDAGLIIPYSDEITLTASVLDLGFIRWRSNQNIIQGSGYFYYDGPLGNSVISENYIDDLVGAFTDSLEITATQNAYTTMLPIKTYLGLKYEINRKLNANGVFSTVIYRSKIISALTASIEYELLPNVYALGSYSLMYRSFKNLGLGFSLGRGPLQFYMISDNVLGLIWPLATKNINLRFGLNINLGCNIKTPGDRGRNIPSLKDACKVFDDRTKRINRKMKHHR